MQGVWVSRNRTYREITLTNTWLEATAQAMIDAVGRLVRDGSICCSFSDLVVGRHVGDAEGQADADDDAGDNLDEEGLNPNQVRAVESSDDPLALIWGPPGEAGICIIIGGLTGSYFLGTGKTTVVVRILGRLFKTLDEEEKILMTASTHNGRSIFCITRTQCLTLVQLSTTFWNGSSS